MFPEKFSSVDFLRARSRLLRAAQMTTQSKMLMTMTLTTLQLLLARSNLKQEPIDLVISRIRRKRKIMRILRVSSYVNRKYVEQKKCP